MKKYASILFFLINCQFQKPYLNYQTLHVSQFEFIILSALFSPNSINFKSDKIQMSEEKEIIPGDQPRKHVKRDTSELNQLKEHSLVVADTGDFTLIQKYKPEDSTTNPSLILQVAQKAEFSKLIDDSIQFGVENYEVYLGTNKKKKETVPAKWEEMNDSEKDDLVDLIFDHLSVSFGCNILKIVKGYVSTEVDAKLSFDKNETVKRAQRLIKLYEAQGIDTSRILIKIASTWEGIKASEVLLKKKIKCNMTLVFHMIQAIACAEAKAFLISPFVGRILDWNKNEYKKTYEDPKEDPGVISVTNIFNYFKKYDHKTVVMGASFRNTGEIKQLAGCDRLTISPKLLEELNSSSDEVSLKLDAEQAKNMDIEKVHITEAHFRHEMNNSKMATDLLSAGIRKFEEDGNKLKDILRKKIENKYKNDE